MSDKPKYLDHNVPVVYADAIANVASSGQVVKLYLGRFDPALDGSNKAQFVPVAQLIMPLDGFAGLATFMSAAIDRMIADGSITREVLNAAREASQSEE